LKNSAGVALVQRNHDMDQTSEIVWLLEQVSIVVLALWLVVRTLFRRRAQTPPTRASHLTDGIVMLLFDLAWAGLCLLVCFNAAFAGATAGFFMAALAVGGGVFLVILYGAVRKLRQAFARSTNGPFSQWEFGMEVGLEKL